MDTTWGAPVLEYIEIQRKRTRTHLQVPEPLLTVSAIIYIRLTLCPTTFVLECHSFYIVLPEYLKMAC